MDFAQQQRNPMKHAVGIGAVVVLHILLGWALLNGLGRKVIEVIKAPIETKIIEEVKPPPPPPEILPPPPKNLPPPPSFVPPPEVAVAPPPVPQPTITTTQVAPPPAPVAIAPAPGPAQPVKSVARAAQIDVSTCEKPTYPEAAAKVEAEGVTKIRFTIDAEGKVAKAEIETPSGSTREHRLLDRTAVEALSKCHFRPGLDENGSPVGAFSIVAYAWKLE
ncbi:energy transducer TonB [Burkholderia sp. MR1-5-21]